jgi:hypothetical protein
MHARVGEKLLQVRSKDSQVKTQLVLLIFILFKVATTGMNHLKIINASRGLIHEYANLKGKLFNCNAVVKLVEALRYKPEGRGFDSRWCNWNFSMT